MFRVTIPLVAFVLAGCSRTLLPGAEGAAAAGDGGADGTSSSTSTSTTSGTGGAGPCPSPPCTTPWAVAFATGKGYVGELTSVASDACGNLVIAGTTGGSVDFGGGLFEGQDRGFLVGLDHDGNYLWGQLLGTDDEVDAVAVDSSRNVFIGGRFSDDLDLGGAHLTSSGLALFIGKLDPAGNSLWLEAFENGTDLLALAMDPRGGIVVTGRTPGKAAMDFGGGPLPLGFKAFVAALDDGGNHRFSHVFGDWDAPPEALAVDDDGNVVIGGRFAHTLSLAGGPLLEAAGSPLSGFDAFLGKLDPHGEHVWSKSFGDDQTHPFVSAAADAAGRVAVAGWFSGTIDLGGGGFTSAAQSGIVGLFDPAGGHIASFVPEALAHPTSVLFRDGLLVGGSPSDYTASITRFDEAGAAIESDSFENGSGAPVVAPIPGGIVFGGTSFAGVDFGTGPLPAPGFYIARACDPPP